MKYSGIYHGEGIVLTTMLKSSVNAKTVDLEISKSYVWSKQGYTTQAMILVSYKSQMLQACTVIYIYRYTETRQPKYCIKWVTGLWRRLLV